MKKEKDRELFFKKLLFRNCNFLVVVVYVYLISVSRATIKWMSFCYYFYLPPWGNSATVREISQLLLKLGHH